MHSHSISPLSPQVAALRDQLLKNEIQQAAIRFQIENPVFVWVRLIARELDRDEDADDPADYAFRTVAWFWIEVIDVLAGRAPELLRDDRTLTALYSWRVVREARQQWERGIPTRIVVGPGRVRVVGSRARLQRDDVIVPLDSILPSLRRGGYWPDDADDDPLARVIVQLFHDWNGEVAIDGGAR